MQLATQQVTGAPGPVPALDELTGGLRATWRSAALSVADSPDLAAFLDGRLDDLVARGRLDQASLSDVLDQTAERLSAAGLEDVVPHVIRRLLRCVYEFLLAVDARAQMAAQGGGLSPVLSQAAGAEADDRVTPGLSPVLHQVEAALKRGQLDEAATSLQLLAGEGSEPELVPVALRAGDRCRDAGHTRAASDCYLAAWTTSRLDERSLWRLASLALAGGDVELASSYLRQVVAVLKWRGDARGVARVQRKMSILAPAAEAVATRATPTAGELRQH